MNLKSVFENAVIASRKLNLMSENQINSVLDVVARYAEQNIDYIVAENGKDLAKMSVDNPMYDRLLLNRERLEGIINDIRNVKNLPSPLGRVLSEAVRPNGMKITKVSVPFGVIGVIYEARPNVSFDVFSLCFKSGSAAILKGGSDAHNSNCAIVSVIKRGLNECGVDENVVSLLPAEREATAELLGAVGYVDLLIPRGSKGLIDYVRDNARVPVIETGAGICHVYFDRDGDVDKCADIVFNSKTRRVSVCNALDCLIVHKDRVLDLKSVCKRLADKNVVIFADQLSFDVLTECYPSQLLCRADETSYGTEFLSYKMSIKCVESLLEAISHITKYSSKHSEAIVSENSESVALFQRSVDAACVYANVSTAFTDGGEFGFGAEIGISTQKLHARGPMALVEITSYKYLITGDGQIR